MKQLEARGLDKPRPRHAQGPSFTKNTSLYILAHIGLGLILGCEGRLLSSAPQTGPDVPRADDGRSELEPTPPVLSEVPAFAASMFEVTTVETRSTGFTVAWPGHDDAEGTVVIISPEPPTVSGEFDSPTRRYALTPTETSFSIDNIAAATDIFVQVRIEEASGSALSGFTHIRTAGGRFGNLDSDLRSVHAFGPQTLLLVVDNPATVYQGGASHEGNTGPAWQSGTWTVTRGTGESVEVVEVHRDTHAIGQPDYPVGYEAYGDGDIVDLEHRIYLTLAEPLGNVGLLDVTHAGDSGSNLEVTIPFSDHYLETPLIQLNQLGYSPQAGRRFAYVSGYRGDGGGADLDGLATAASLVADWNAPLSARTEIVSLPVSLRSAYDTDVGAEVFEIDLAEAPAAEGHRYRVRLPGIGVSYPTSVSEEAANRAYYTVARGMYQNRWCGELDAEFTEWPRAADHCEAYFVSGTSYEAFLFNESTPQEDLRPVVGGHHDAGDFDIRPFHVVVGQYLMRAFEHESERHTDGQFHIPESSNGIPDLLDEALWSLQAWEALQNDDGSVRAGVESWSHPRGIYPADEDELPYWTFDPEPWHTAYVAALFAQASRLVHAFDSDRAAGLRERALRAYRSSVGQAAPATYRIYAASELFALTGEAEFKRDFEDLWRSLNVYGGGGFDALDTMLNVYPGAFSGHQPAMADFFMGYFQADGADASITALIEERLLALADEASDRIIDSVHAHRHGRPANHAPDWGHSSSTGRHLDHIYQALQLPGLSPDRRQRYIDAASLSADFALGANPLGMTFITGLGTEQPRQPLHLDTLVSLASGRGTIPGIPVFGPVQNPASDSYYLPTRDAHYPSLASRPLGRRYVDARASVNTNEFTIWENQAPFTQLFSILSAGIPTPSSWRPGATDHRLALTAQVY